MEIIDAAVNPYHITTLKIQLGKAELKCVCRGIYGKCLITLPEYQNIKRDTNKRHKRNYMGVGARLQSHKAKIKEEISNDTFRHLQNP